MAKKSITQTGPVGLKGIRNPDLYPDSALKGVTPEDMETAQRLNYEGQESNYNISHGHTGYDSLSNDQLYKPENVPLGSPLSSYGESSYDTGILNNATADEMTNQRSDNESTFSKWAAGFGKMAVLAGTTALDGTIGTLTGVANMAKTVAEGGDASDALSSFWNNPFSQVMQGINNWSEKAMPNYQSTEEQNNPWYNNIFTANFWADNVIKNIGFTVGAYVSGKAITGLASEFLNINKARDIFKGAAMAADSDTSVDDIVNAYKNGDEMLGQLAINKRLADSSKFIKHADFGLQLGGSFAGAFGEARQEAIQNSASWLKGETGYINDYYNQAYQNNLNTLMQQRPDMFQQTYDNQGNPVITPTNDAAIYIKQTTDKQFNKDQAFAMANKDAAKMGNVDFLLNIPILTASNMVEFGRLFSNGYKTASKLNPILKEVGEDGVERYVPKTTGKLQALATTLKTGISEGPYEEMMQQVAQTIPAYKYSADINSYYGAKIDPTAEANTTNWLKATAKSMIDTYGSADQWEQGFIGALTGVMGVPGVRSFKNSEGKYQSPLTLQGGALGDIQEMNETNKSTKEYTDRLNSIIQDPKRLNYYQNLVRQYHYGQRMSDAAISKDNFEYQNASDASLISDIATFSKADRLQDLKDMINSASSIKPEDVSKDGGIRQFTMNQNTNENDVFPPNMSDEDVVAKIQDNATKINKTIDDYAKVSDDVDTIYGGRLSQDAMDEVTFMTTHIKSLEDRFESLRKDITNNLSNMYNADNNMFYNDENGKPTTIGELLNAPTMELLTKLGSSPALAEALKQDYNKLTESYKIPNRGELLGDIEDLSKIAVRRNNFIDILNDYKTNPNKLEADIQNQKEDIANKVAVKDLQDSAVNLQNSANQQDFNTNYNDLVNKKGQDHAEKVKQVLVQVGNPFAKTHTDIEDYLSNLNKELIKSGSDSGTIKDAEALLKEHAISSDSLTEVANPNSMYQKAVSSNVFEKDIDRKTRAVNLLQQGMYNLNSVLAKKDDYSSVFNSPTYLKPESEVASKPIYSDKETTGADQTIPGIEEVSKLNVLGTLGDDGTFNPNVSPVKKDEEDKSNTTNNPPINSTTQISSADKSDIADTNSKVNNTDSQQTKQRNFYYPGVSQFQQDAMKDNRFLPLNATGEEKLLLIDYYNKYRQTKGLPSISPDDIDFNDIYDYLDKAGAFDYVNKGNLKTGDTITFMIDPNFKGSREDPNKPTIFMVKGSQIVGSLPQASSIINNTPGLKELIDRVYKGYNNQSNTKVKYYSNESTHVSKIMNGKIQFGNTMRNLADVNGIHKVNDNGKPVKIKLGIIKNGTLETGDQKINGKTDISGIVSKEGYLYLLVPNSDNGYSIANIRVKHLDNEDFPDGSSTTMADGIHKNIYGSIKDSINELAEASLQHEEGKEDFQFAAALQDLNKLLYLGDYSFHLREKDGKKMLFIQYKENSIPVFLNNNNGNRTNEQISTDIENALKASSPLIQVDVNKINKGSYNDYLLNSNILESNIDKAEVVGSWFTTNTLDNNGKEVKAVNPVYTKPSTTVTTGTTNVNLATKQAVDKNNNPIELTQERLDVNQIRASKVAIPEDGIMLAPSNNLINMNTGKYLTNKEVFDYNVKQLRNTNEVIKQLLDDQTLVDKTKTDKDGYQVMEEDGKYHTYERVHKVLGSNSNSTQVQGTESTAALINGNTVDAIVRSFFTGESFEKPITMSENAYNSLLSRLRQLQKSFNKNGERVLANNIVLFHKYNDGKRIAGEVDLITMDKSGRVNIYDVKTSHKPFGYFNGKHGTTNYFDVAGSYSKVSTKEYYTRQLASYSNLLYSQYGIETNHLGLIPFIVNLDIDDSKDTEQQKLDRGIQSIKPSNIISEIPSKMIDENNTVVTRFLDVKVSKEALKDKVPMEASKRVIDKSTISTDTDVVTNLPTTNMEVVDLKQTNSNGYFEAHGNPVIEGKIYKAHLDKLAEGVYLGHVPTYGEHNKYEGDRYYLVTPNGYGKLLSIDGIRGPVDKSVTEVSDLVKGQILPSSGEAISKMSQLSTSLVPKVNISNTTSNTSSNKRSNDIMGESIDKVSTLNGVPKKAARRPKTKNRFAIGEYTQANIEEELNWLNKVLPQLSRQQLVSVHKGLIRVARLGTSAWGQFKNGMIIISDKASQGTVYHEAFHAVFNLLTEEKERNLLYEEARSKYGNISNSRLEELMAEDFRRYTTNKEKMSLGDKIINFFKDLYNKVTNWNRVSPFIDSYYRKINNGYYSDYDLSVSSLNDKTNTINNSNKSNKTINFADIDADTLTYLRAKGWTEELFNSLTKEERDQAIKCATV